MKSIHKARTALAITAIAALVVTIPVTAHAWPWHKITAPYSPPKKWTPPKVSIPDPVKKIENKITTKTKNLEGKITTDTRNMGGKITSEAVKGDEAVDLATKKVERIVLTTTRKAVATLKNVLKNLGDDKYTKDCQKFALKITYKVAPYIPVPVVNSIPFIDGRRCKAEIASGFICGGVAMVSEEISDINSANKDMTDVAQAVHYAYYNKPCEPITDPVERSACSVVIGMASLAKRAMLCVQKSLVALEKDVRGFNILDADTQNAICRETGQMGFNAAWDAATDEDGEEVQEVRKYADNVSETVRKAEQAAIDANTKLDEAEKKVREAAVGGAKRLTTCP
jgi:hypothetical protein